MSQKESEVRTSGSSTSSSSTSSSVSVSTGGLVIVGLAITWVILCVYSVVRAIECTGKTGTPQQKVAGIVLAGLFGPFYFLYAPNGYCGTCPSGHRFVPPDPNQQRIVVPEGTTPPWCQRA